jgi:hypothetical protein
MMPASATHWQPCSVTIIFIPGTLHSICIVTALPSPSKIRPAGSRGGPVNSKLYMTSHVMSRHTHALMQQTRMVDA